jgi:hypothetical protein
MGGFGSASTPNGFDGSNLRASQGCPRERRRGVAALRVYDAGRHRQRGTEVGEFAAVHRADRHAEMRMLFKLGSVLDVTSWRRCGAIVAGLALSAEADHR